MKNLGQIVKTGVITLLTGALLAGTVYGIATSRISLKPKQGAIVRELRNVNNNLEVAPRAIENETDSKKTFWKQPYLPFKIGSIEAYINLDEEKEVQGTFGFWTADKLTFNENDKQYVRAFNFGFDKKIINLNLWAKWDPLKIYTGLSSSEMESREEGLSQIVESLFLTGIRDQFGNFELDEENEAIFLGLNNQINLWYTQLVARHDFLIDKLGENNLLDELDNKEKIRKFYNEFFEKYPWHMIGPIRLQAEGANLRGEYEKFYFSQYPWYTYGMFYNNVSAETKQDIMNALFGKQPPKDMMKNQENRVKDFEKNLYRDYPKLNELSENLEDVIKYEAKLNMADLIEKNNNEYRKQLSKEIPDEVLAIVKVINKNVSETSKEYLSELGDKISINPEIEQEVMDGISNVVSDYAQEQFETAVMAIQKDRLEVEMEGINEEISKLEETLTEESKAISEQIMKEYLIGLKNMGYELDYIGMQGLQQTLAQYLQTKGDDFITNNEASVKYAWATLLKQQMGDMLNDATKSFEELSEKEVAKWMHDGIESYINQLGVTPKDVDETNLAQIIQDYVQGIQGVFQYATSYLNVDVHNYKIEKDRNDAEGMRKKLAGEFNEYLMDKKEKEMRLWDYALEEIISNSKELENYDKSKEEDMEKVKEIRDRFVYKFIEQEAPEYFKEFMEKFHGLPYEESLGVVISNPELKMENEELFKGGIINKEYENLSKQLKQKEE